MSKGNVRRVTRQCVLLCTFLASGVYAQSTSLISGQNINMVSGTEFPTGDPFLQRQNEPTIGVSTRNELHLMGGSNDYRAVDLPGLPEGKTTGDSWISSYFSYDGGGRWTSTLLPGYPQDPSCLEPESSPTRHVLCGYEASADPVIRPGTHGLFYYSGIAFTRSDDPPSAGFVNTYIDLNNDERGDSIKFVRTTLFDTDPGGSFIDKPWIAVDKPRNAAITTIQVPTETGPISQNVQCGNLYAAWARIQGEGTAATESQIMFAKSEDCGATFSAPKQLTLPGTINQGAAIAVSPLDGKIQVAWRQFSNSTMSCVRKGNYWRRNPEAWPVDEIELAGYTLLSSNRGNIIVDDDDSDDDYDDDDHDDDSEDDDGWEHDDSETQRPPKLLRQLLTAWLNVLAGADATEISDTLDSAEAWFLDNASGHGNKTRKKEGKRLHKKLRRFNNGRLGPPKCDDVMSMGPTGMNPDAIIVTTSNDLGETFSAPVAAVSSEDYYFPFEQGTTEYSFRSTGYPTTTFDGEGRSYLAFTTRGLAVPDFDVVGGDGRVVVTTSMDGVTWTGPLPIDEPEQRGHQLMPTLDFARGKIFLLYYDFREDVSGVFDRFVTDLPVDATTPRHSVDVRAAQALAADVPTFTNYSVLDGGSTQASRYPFLILSDAAEQPVSQQTKYNPPNLPMFKGGLVPFFGDFIDIATLHFVKDETGGWDFNTDPADGAPVAHAVWTDNRDVVPPLDGDWTSYVPPGTGGGTSIFDPGQDVPVCTPSTVGDRTKMRNQNIYTSRLTQGLAVAVPGNNRPLGVIQRAFVGFVQNLTNEDKAFRLEILNQPTGGAASFEQFSQIDSVVEVVERNSSISRSIYVSSTDSDASVDIRVIEVDSMGDPVGNGLTATTRINTDPSAPPPVDAGILTAEQYTPAIFNPAIFNPAIFNPSLLGNDPNIGIYNPAIFNPAIFNNPEDAEFKQFALQQQSLLNPAIFNPAIFNPAIFNPAIFNPAIFNPAIFNPAIFNPAIFNPAIFNVGVSNPAIFNPAIFNPAIFNSTLQDTVLETSVVIENQGNATAAYSLNLDLDQPPEGFLFQVMVYRTYSVPTVEGCELVNSVQQEQLVNELTPDVNGSLLNPDATTFYIPPDDNVVVTVRVVPDPAAPVPGDPATINTLETLQLSQAVAPQAVDTVSAAAGETEPQPVVVVTPTVPVLVINAVSVADAMVGSSYSQMFSTAGGDGSPVIWSLVPGSTLPPGLSLNASGQIAGTATAQGVFNFDVRAKDDVQFAEQAFSINVLPGGAGALFTESVIGGDSDILNDGVFVVANDLGAAPSSVSVNGVPFGTNQAGFAGFVNGGGDFSSDPFSPELDALLSDQVFTQLLTPVTLTIPGLTPGQTYRLQLLFANDQNLTGNNIAISVQGDTYVLDDWQDAAINLQVEFVASGSSVVVTFQPGPTFVPGTIPFDEPGRSILSAYALHSAPFFTGPVVDQQQSTIEPAAGGFGIFQEPTTGGAGQTLVQTVTTGITGTLDAVLLPVQCNSLASLVVQIQGLDGGGQPNGVVLASQVVSGMSFPQFGGNPVTFRQIGFSNPASFNVGDQFAIVIDAPGQNGCDMFKGPASDPYAPGQGFFDSRPPSMLQPLFNDGGRDDLPFQTLVTPGPGPTVFNASFDSVVLNSSTVEIGGTSGGYSASFSNAGATPLSIVVIQARIDQPGASRAAGGSQVSCGSGTGVLPPGSCGGNYFLGANNTTSAGFGTLTTGPATARIDLRINSGFGPLIDTVTLPINLVPPPSINWRADFDFASNSLNLPPYTYECVRTFIAFNTPPPAGTSFSAQIFNSQGVSQGTSGSINVGGASSVGYETFSSGPDFDFPIAQGYQLLQFSQALNSISNIEYRGQTPCSGVGTPNQFVPGRLTAQP